MLAQHFSLQQNLVSENFSSLPLHLVTRRLERNVYRKPHYFPQEKEHLTSELDSLKKTYDSFKAQFDALSQGKSALEKNLHSVTYLKEALKKAKMEERLAKVEKEKQKYAQGYHSLKYGNRGYIIKDKKPTYGTHVKVEVLPAE